MTVQTQPRVFPQADFTFEITCNGILVTFGVIRLLKTFWTGLCGIR